MSVLIYPKTISIHCFYRTFYYKDPFYHFLNKSVILTFIYVNHYLNGISIIIKISLATNILKQRIYHNCKYPGFHTVFLYTIIVSLSLYPTSDMSSSSHRESPVRKIMPQSISKTKPPRGNVDTCMDAVIFNVSIRKLCGVCPSAISVAVRPSSPNCFKFIFNS